MLHTEHAVQSSPPELCPAGRTRDSDAIVHVMAAARRFIHIAVMDYGPCTVYSDPHRFG